MNNMNIHTCTRLYSTNTAINALTLHTDTTKWRESIRMSMNIPPRNMRTTTCPISIIGMGINNIDAVLKTACESCFAKIIQEGNFDGIIGKPKIQYESSNLAFSHKTLKLSTLSSKELIAIQPIQKTATGLWMGLTAKGSLLKI